MFSIYMEHLEFNVLFPMQLIIPLGVQPIDVRHVSDLINLLQ